MHAVVARGDDDTGRHRRPTNDLILYKKVGVLTGSKVVLQILSVDPSILKN